MKRILLVAALLVGSSALAETPSTGTGTGQTGTSTGQTGTSTGQTGTSTGTTTSQPGMQQPGMQQAKLDDATIAGLLMAANDIDVQAGDMARTRSTNADVKAFAERMVNEHGAVNKRLKDLDTRLNLKPNDTNDQVKRLHADADQAMTRIKSLKGADFDRAYIDQEVNFHTRVLEVIDTQMLPNVQNSDLKSLVNEVRPAIQAHLTQAKQIQSKLKAPA